MKLRLLVALGATHLALAACSSANSPGDEPGPSLPPMITDASAPPSVGVDVNAFPDAVVQATPPGCPSNRSDGPASDVDETTFRARIVGTYRVCGLPGFGIEVRIDDETDGILWYSLDDRFVRNDEANGRIEIKSCSGSSCTVAWIVSRFGAPEETSTRTLTMWNEPVAVDTKDGMFPEAWLRVGD